MMNRKPESSQQQTLPLCENCGIAIRWQPTVIDGHIYCCLGCSQGGPCECDYDHLPMPEDRVSLTVWRQQIAHTATQDKAIWMYESEYVQVHKTYEKE